MTFLLIRRPALFFFFVLFLFSIFLFPFSGFAAAQEHSWRTSMETGKRAFEERRYADAEIHFLAALKLAESFSPEDPNLLLTLRNVATVYSVQNRAHDLEKTFEEFLALREKSAGRDAAASADVALALGRASRQVRQYATAEKFLKRSLAAREKVSGKVHLKAAEILDEFALLNLAWLREVGAQSSAPRNVSVPYAPTLATNTVGIRPPRTEEVPYPQPAKGTLLNDNSGAEKFARRALAIREKILGPDHIDLVPDLASLLGPACLRQSHLNPRKLDEALGYYNRALSIVEKAGALPNPVWAEAISTHAGFHHASGRFGPAEQLYRQSLAIFEKVYGPDARQLILPLREFAALLKDSNRPLDAAEFEARASAIAAKRP